MSRNGFAASETGNACAQESETLRAQVLTLAETLDHLRGFHRRAPFLFFNGNPLAIVDRELIALPESLLRD